MSWVNHRWFRWSLLFLAGLFVCLGLGSRGVAGQLPPGAQPSSVQSDLAGRSADQGVRSYETGQYLEAIAVWEQALPQANTVKEKTILYSNLGQAYEQIGKPDQAIAAWESAIQLYRKINDSASRLAIAQLMTEQAQAYSDLGQHQTAIERSQAAIKLAQTSQDLQTEAAAQGSLGNAQWSLGDYTAALDAHQQSLNLACRLNNTGYESTALNNLGNVFSSRAERFRYQANAANLEGDTDTASKLTDLAQRDTQIALAAYQHSAEVSAESARSRSASTEARALLNLNRLLKQLPPNATVPVLPELACETLNVKGLLSTPTLVAQAPTQSPVKATEPPQPAPQSSRKTILHNHAQILARLETEADSQDKAYGYINLANNLMVGLDNSIKPDDFTDIQGLLGKALIVSRNVHDGRAESFALGTLGRIYEKSRQYEQAMDWTRQAQFVAQRVSAADSLYRWQWQIGRIFKSTGKTGQAIAAYEQAIATLQSIRGDIAIANKDLQFDFRDSVEPVYRELISLLFDQSPQPGQPSPDPRLKSLDIAATPTAPHAIEKVLDILELLKLAEIQNFFGDDCVQVAKDAINTEHRLPKGGDSSPSYGLFDANAAIVYSIVLEDRSYLILRLSNGTLTTYPIQLTSDRGPVPAGHDLLQSRIDRFRALLEKRATEEYLTESQAIYNALIRPMEAELLAAKPATIVFINDGVLRKVPMAALHDGTQFLIEKYPIATTPSLSLTSRRPLDRTHLKALIMGLTIEKPPFAALPNVGAEVKEVQKIIGGTELVDQAFTLKSMQERLTNRSYPIIHMATHGKFGADAANTFLLDYSDRITIDQLDTVLRKRSDQAPIELLTLSACQTAAGDNRSALGIAGVAVRAGVKSAVATLWFINDQATVPLIEEFYTQLLKPGTSKAEALRRAQIKLIGNSEYNHPAVWSPFILIGNWL